MTREIKPYHERSMYVVRNACLGDTKSRKRISVERGIGFYTNNCQINVVSVSVDPLEPQFTLKS